MVRRRPLRQISTRKEFSDDNATFQVACLDVTQPGLRGSVIKHYTVLFEWVHNDRGLFSIVLNNERLLVLTRGECPQTKN